jgi:hypothetical protein
LAQVDAFFVAQLAARADCGAEPDTLPEDDAASGFPADLLVCD